MDRWSQGAFREVMRECIRELGLSPYSDFSLERSETISCLRHLCAKYGDNDWDDDLHLVDIIEKHLIKHLDL